MGNPENLLTPELKKDANFEDGFFSIKAMMLSSFFVGPVAPIIMGASNSKSFRRWSSEKFIFVGLFVIYLLMAYYWASCFSEASNAIELNKIRSENLFLKFFMRGFGVVFYIAVYLMHQKAFKAAEFSDVKPASPWVAVVLAILIESLVELPFLYFFGLLGGA